MSNKSAVWPGPSLLIPIPTDVLLIGQGDVNAQTTWANLKNNYYALWRYGKTAQPDPFSKGSCPPVGAHLMWTLPNSLRQGKQQSTEGAPVVFPLVPNRWLITRFGYSGPGIAPDSTPTIVQSDILVDAGGNIQNVNQYPFYEDTNLGVRQIGTQVPLSQFTGEDSGSAELKAVGPGDVTWAVSYDNIQNVFALHDKLPDETKTYSYSIIGWYADPQKDPLYHLPVDSDKNWLSFLESQFNWTSEDVEQSVADWQAWQKQYGLSGVWDPSSLNLPEQAKAMIEAWHSWEQQNGISSGASDLPTQALYHSMVATVQWKGENKSYGTGAPIGSDGKQKLPTLSVANTPEEAISTYMATKAAEVPGSGITKADIPNLAIALEAFQRDLLFDLQTDPEWAQSMLHDTQFDKKYRGQEWIVVRSEGTSKPQKQADMYRQGQQSIPLNPEQTQALIQLNTDQAALNELGWTISTQQLELYALAMKKEYLTYNRSTINPDNWTTLTEKTNGSIKAISSSLSENQRLQITIQNTIKTSGDNLQVDLGEEYVLKAVDLDPVASPADPVVLISGGELDTKLLPPELNGVSQLLPTRFTGQTITSISVTYTPVQQEPIAILWEDLLGKVTLASWNAFPKEVQSLWLEVLLLDTSNAQLIANTYFEKAGKTPQTNQLEELTAKIQAQQTSCWTDFETKPPTEALTAACGFGGLLPDPVGVAFRPDKNPWTPIFMDWKIKWFPSSTEVADALVDWELGELDYSWQGSALKSPSPEIVFKGRAILNQKTTQNIQTKFTTFKNDTNFKNLPKNTIQNLQWVANNISYMDMVTQSMAGFNLQLNTVLNTMKNQPLDAGIQDQLSGNSYFDPVTGSTSVPDAGPFFPIRSGHFQVLDLWLVDSYGQILPGKSNLLGPDDPIENIVWSPDLTTSSPNYTGSDTGKFGQLPPRLTQDALMTPRFLQHDDDRIFTNSSDSTSPICGWVMANYLDDALMVFDAGGSSQGEVIKVRREVTGNDNNLTIRWDAAPGRNTALGALPDLSNQHLQNFINALLSTGTTNTGAMAYTELMNAIDSNLWFTNQLTGGNNLSVLLGRPLAVVRAEVELTLSGDPAYNQGWYQTGEYYNNNGIFNPQDPPFLKVKFNVRIGDSLMKKNGVMGYFVNDDYTKFYKVYGLTSETEELQRLLKSGGASLTLDQVKSALTQSPAPTSGYVITDHLVTLAANGGPVKLTLIMDPTGDLPIIPGSLPGSSISLPNGPVTAAIENLSATFRTGPLLLDPSQIRMPTPAEVRGDWAWLARKDVTEWQPDMSVTQQIPQASLSPQPLSLIEGWLSLSNFNKKK
ncbi:hypothetical protein SAMN04489724_0100 [Algoriphagus locisalis]|uniref:Uncharacterized protein n=1 Tax=Algoriphagus locisalis TaxID=305507 RepID=A0A1I7E580_9BACT|nr:hypothetical protein [Algoriphagus locisalis]SFU19101.1 hypothetical protein SAMN04489724_0100 [Algoriphagus locisalis]